MHLKSEDSSLKNGRSFNHQIKSINLLVTIPVYTIDFNTISMKPRFNDNFVFFCIFVSKFNFQSFSLTGQQYTEK